MRSKPRPRSLQYIIYWKKFYKIVFISINGFGHLNSYMIWAGQHPKNKNYFFCDNFGTDVKTLLTWHWLAKKVNGHFCVFFLRKCVKPVKVTIRIKKNKSDIIRNIFFCSWLVRPFVVMTSLTHLDDKFCLFSPGTIFCYVGQ